tara:strand:- start:174 stop:422 length:249 start_codon:yes stop_codon:yes gene_type:complete
MRAPVRIHAHAKQALAKLANRPGDQQQEIGQAAQIAPDHLRAWVRGVNLDTVLLRVGELAMAIAADNRQIVVVSALPDMMKL